MDEWIFTLRLPPGKSTDASSNGFDSNGSNVDEKQLKGILYDDQGRFVQLKGTTDTTANSVNNDRKPKFSSTSAKKDDDDELIAASSTTAVVINNGKLSNSETAALIRHDSNNHVKDSSCCWKFTSSTGCNLSSSCLLELHYRPDWQGIAEYTTKRPSKLISMMKSCCAPCCSSYSKDNEEFIADYYTINDIVDIIPLSTDSNNSITVPGIGLCQGIQVLLRPHYNNASSSPSENEGELSPKPKLPHTPHELQSVMNRYWNRAIKQQLQRDAESNTKYTKQQESSKSHDQCIVVTFAMPKKGLADQYCDFTSPPPLLWKVELPPVKANDDNDDGIPSSLFVDTITVLDGMVENNGPSSSLFSHAYIQGYQSWSFAGSVTKGDPQPKPVLPSIFSGAFNRGGIPPPTMTNAATQAIMSHTSHEAYSLRGSSERQKRNLDRPYQSNFYTCLTTDTDPIINNGFGDRVEGSINRQEHQILDEQSTGPSLVVGWLSQHEQYGIIRMNGELDQIEMQASHQGLLLPSLANENIPGSSSIKTDWAYAQWLDQPQRGQHYDEEPMASYLESVAGYHDARPLQNGPLLTGWCSWYHYYENISNANIRSNVNNLAQMRKSMPTNVIIVDDGYMTAWGDWDEFPKSKFPNKDSVALVARDIKSQGMKPGLWLAPYACDKHSKLAKQHPDWIIRNDAGQPANSSNCGKFFYGLDATNPAVREYVAKCIRRAVQDWGYEVLKIDFLYAACLVGNGKYDMTVSRAQAMHMAMETIRQAAGPNVFLIGCGCPIGSGIGYVDGMRVSADTGPTFYPALPFPYWDHGGTLPAVRAMVRNTLSRISLSHRWWHNDPDCLLLRDTTSLTTDEVVSAATAVAMTSGMMLLSDDLTLVSPGRLDILKKIFPMTGITAIALDLHNNRHPHSLPHLLRVWCTDEFHDTIDTAAIIEQSAPELTSVIVPDYNAAATYFGRRSSFQSMTSFEDEDMKRQRSCIHVAHGLGTWNVISLSNWYDHALILQVPPDAYLSHGASTASFGYHVFSFWSSKYNWIPSGGSGDGITKRLCPHETEIFHIRPVTPEQPQYIGSDMHFSCGIEVSSFVGPTVTNNHNQLQICLKTMLQRSGNIYVFVPIVDTSHVRVTVADQPTPWSVIGNTPRNQEILGNGGPNGEGTMSTSPRAASSPTGSTSICGRIIRIPISIQADGATGDGKVVIDY